MDDTVNTNLDEPEGRDPLVGTWSGTISIRGHGIQLTNLEVEQAVKDALGGMLAGATIRADFMRTDR